MDGAPVAVFAGDALHFGHQHAAEAGVRPPGQHGDRLHDAGVDRLAAPRLRQVLPQFLKFCGMDLATVQSGMFRRQSRIPKYGNARLRRTLWMAGQTAVLKRTNSFRDTFGRSISKDRHNAHLRRKACTAIAAKIARAVHAVVNHGDPYRPFFEG